MAKQKRTEGYIAENRKARHDYTIEDSLEAGIMLLGSEVKSIRMQGGVSLVESHAGEKQGDLYLFNANIPEYKMSNQFNHEPRRPRKLLLKKKELNKLSAAVKRQGIALIPLKMYFNKRGLVKLLLGIASGKKKADKREADKQRDWQRQKERILKNS
ncbi:MAG: SsrA-binding protein SmpB [Alphaproteobacteria bacterium]|nr:SsrA-binding protein SmpB [Alphaproteobacteria bacterium]NCQ66977.1 SsrA-binding protein SmpB [Alphaproteobacteria bacterium]NCT07543.1 SsrA-binding protein SmpB [Alphaproteobacteria bacterium]